MRKSAPPTSRSPIRDVPLPLPGDSSQLRLVDVLVEKCLIWVAGAVFAVVLAVLEWWRWYSASPPAPVQTTIVAVAACLVAGTMAVRGIRQARQLRLGIDGERDVARILEDLRTLGYHVLHDIDGDRGNVDHVAIGPAGVFVIETKTRSKPIGRDAKVEYDGTRVLVDGYAPDRDPIAQAKAAASHVRGILEAATRTKPPVRAAVVFPGWWVVSPPRPEVWVLNPTRLLGYIRHEPIRLADAQVNQLAAALATHVRATLNASK